MEHKDKLFYGFLLLMISPVFSLIANIYNFRFKEARWLLVLFFGVFGMTMVVLPGKDAKVHTDSFSERYVSMDFHTFLRETQNIILFKSNDVTGESQNDLYLHVLSYIGSIFSSNPAILIFLASLIYGYYYIRGINLVFKYIKPNKNFVLIIILFFFVLWKSIEGINSIRNWTAAWIFFNGSFSYFETKKLKYVGLVLIAPLIHFAYFLITIPFFVILVLGNRPKIYLAFLLVSFFVNIENVDVVREYLVQTDLGSQKIGYIREGSSQDYLIEGGAESFHAKYYLAAAKLALSILFYYAFTFMGYIYWKKHTYLMMSLASMGILMIAFSNVVTFSVTINNRVFTNGGLFALAYLVLLYNDRLTKNQPMNAVGFNIATYLSLPLIGFFAFTQLSQMGDFTDVRIFLSPVIYWVFQGDFPLKQVLRNLIL